MVEEDVAMVEAVPLIMVVLLQRQVLCLLVVEFFVRVAVTVRQSFETLTKYSFVLSQALFERWHQQEQYVDVVKTLQRQCQHCHTWRWQAPPLRG